MKTNALYLVFIALMLIAGCNYPVNTDTHPASTALKLRTEIASPTPLILPAQTSTGSVDQGPATITLDAGNIAQGASSQVVPEVPDSIDGPWWEALPEHTRLTLQSYPVTNHLFKAQIFVYPVKDLGINQVGTSVSQELQALLASQEDAESLPYLPPYNAAQVMHSQVKFLDFTSGKGMRYLTQFDQAPLPVNNHELHYTYQGLTSDGKYYVAAVLPVSLNGLPESEIVTGTLPANYMENFSQYMADTVNMLNQQPSSAFTPDLAQLDNMMQSIKIH